MIMEFLFGASLSYIDLTFTFHNIKLLSKHKGYSLDSAFKTYEINPIIKYIYFNYSFNYCKNLFLLFAPVIMGILFSKGINMFFVGVYAVLILNHIRSYLILKDYNYDVPIIPNDYY